MASRLQMMMFFRRLRVVAVMITFDAMKAPTLGRLAHEASITHHHLHSDHRSKLATIGIKVTMKVSSIA
jgi:hypothetical protein